MIGLSANHLSSYDDDALDREDEFIFLDSYDICGEFQFDLIRNAISAAAAQGNKEAANLILEMVKEYDIYFDQETADCVNENALAVECADEFKEYILSHSGENAQASLINNFTPLRSISAGYYLGECWLDALDRDGLLARFKKGNRWYIKVA